MSSTVYGVKVSPTREKMDYWLSENRIALQTFVRDQKAEMSEEDVHEVSLEILKEYQEKLKTRTRISLIKTRYEISDPSETEKIHVPFLHFHNAERAWKHFHENE